MVNRKTELFQILRRKSTSSFPFTHNALRILARDFGRIDPLNPDTLPPPHLIISLFVCKLYVLRGRHHRDGLIFN